MNNPLLRVNRAFRVLAAAVAIALISSVIVTSSATSAAAVGTRTISGHVYLGTTATPAGEGEVVVQFTKQSTAHNPADFVPTAADGSYIITGLEPGKYHLFVDYVGTGAYSDMYWPSQLQFSSIWFVDVSVVDYTNRDQTLPQYAPLAGTVYLDTTATPAGAGDVTVYYSELVNGVWGDESTGVPTDAAGHYAFPPIHAGIYTLRFDYVGAGTYQDRVWPTGTVYAGRKSISFFAGTTVVNSNITLLKPMTITGVVHLKDSPQNVSPFTLPADGFVTLTLSLLGSPTPIVSTTVDSSGVFSLPGMTSGQGYLLALSAPGYFPISLNFTPSASFPTYTYTITQPRELYRQITVTGHIYLGDDSRSASAGEVTVAFIEAGENSHLGYQGSGVTDADGNYSIAGLTGQNYSVKLTYSGSGDYLETRPPLPQPWPGHAGLWTPTPTSNQMDFTVDPGNEIAGTVSDSAGAPIPGIHVYVTRYNGETGAVVDDFTTTTDANGAYAFVRLVDGFYGVDFEGTGYVSQSWPGVSYYYSADIFELEGGDHFDADATMHHPGTISGGVLVGDLQWEDLYWATATLYVYDEFHDRWRPIDAQSVTYYGQYSFGDLEPGEYRVKLGYTPPSYVGNIKVWRKFSPVIELGEGETKTFHSEVIPVSSLYPPAIVKGPGPTLYFVAEVGELIPLASLSSATDAGMAATYTTVTQKTIDNHNIAPYPLSNVIDCGNRTVLSAEGLVWPIDPELVAGLRQTQTGQDVCDHLPRYDIPISDHLFLSSPAGLTYEVWADGTKHQVLTTVSLAALAAPQAPRAYRVNDYFLGTIPTGLKVLPAGAMVKGPGARVWFVTDADTLVPVPTFDVTKDMGLPSTYFTVSQAELNQASPVDDPGTALTNTLVCSGQTYFAASGKLWPIAAPLVAGLRQTVLNASACSVLPKASTTVRGGLFVQSSTSAAMYYITATGEKRQISGRVSMGALSYPYDPIVVRAADSFLSSLPTGPPVVPYLGKKPPAGTVQAPLANAATTVIGSTPSSSTLTLDQRVTCYSDYFQALGAGLFAPLSGTADLNADCRNELSLDPAPAG